MHAQTKDFSAAANIILLLWLWFVANIFVVTKNSLLHKIFATVANYINLKTKYIFYIYWQLYFQISTY